MKKTRPARTEKILAESGLPGLPVRLDQLFRLQAALLAVTLAAAVTYILWKAGPDTVLLVFLAVAIALLAGIVVYVHFMFSAPSRKLTSHMVSAYRRLPGEPVRAIPRQWRPWFNMVSLVCERLYSLEAEVDARSADYRTGKNLLRRFSWVFERNEVLAKELKAKNQDLEHAVEEQRKTFLELKHHRDHLDDMIRERTADLMKTNRQLQEAIEEARRQAQNAQDANKAKSQFLANVSHEIRTPLNAVIGFTDMIIDTRLDDTQLDFARTIRNSSDSLLFLINDLLDFSKIESGELEFETIDFSLELLAYDVCELIRPQIGKKPIELVCRIGEEVPAHVKGDPTRFQQILLNLMGNAPKFTESGEISLTMNVEEQVGERLRILCRVQDTGIGIPEEKQKSIFEPFQQADGSTTRKYGGTGLGLSISRQLSRLMGGDIWVESELDMGSTFYFSAWLGRSVREESWKTTAAGISGKQVLIVDDNQNNLEILSSALKSAGVRVSDLRSGMEVVPTLERAITSGNPFDCCIIDIHMPGMSGYEVAREIRTAKNSKIAGLMLVAASFLVERDPELFAQAGFDQSVIKPIRRERLFEVLGQLMGVSPRKGVPPKNHTEEVNAVSFNGRILVAEDNAVNQKLIEMMLKKLGNEVVLAETGKDAADRITAAPDLFDLVFMDIQMPEMDGFEALKVIRERGITNIPVIAMTAHAMKEHRDECLEAGMSDYISKPIRRAALIEVLERFLEPRAM